jgi:CRP/FNR family transcriptional regulator
MTQIERKCHTQPDVSCSDCRLGELCLPIALDSTEIDQLDNIIKRGRPLNKGNFLFEQGEPFTAIYAVRAGSFKTFQTSRDGEEQVTGFYLPGEILGMDGISSMQHVSSAIALETGSVCEIPFELLEKLSSQISSLQGRFFQLMSKEITKDQQMLTLLSQNSSDERVASLLLSISARHHQRKLSMYRFRLPMTRAEIGSYLGITLETVSRIFSRLQKQGVITVENKEITINELEQLKEIAGVCHK